MLAKDIMRRKIVTVGSRLTLQELMKVLEKNGISGAPVVDDSGAVLGVVSQTDLVRSRREAAPGVPLYHREIDGPSMSLGIHFEEYDQTRVEQIMTSGAISFDEETPVEALADAMLARHIHRVLITRGERLVGIVTTMDFMRALVAVAKKAAPGRARKIARRH
jgi:CBS domain-containing protein